MNFSANNIEQISRIVASYITGSKITNMLENLRIRPKDDNPNNTKWIRIHNAITASQNAGFHNTLISVVEYVMDPVNFYNRIVEYQNAIKELNVILLLDGLQLTESGKINRVTPAQTLSEARSRALEIKEALSPFNIHPQILAFCTPEILSENYFHLIFEATKCVLNHLRIISGLNLDGNQLVNSCFDGKNPLMLINRFDTASAKDEHKGLHSLLNLLVYWFRDPKAHELKCFSQDSKEDAVAAIILISKARTLLDKCFLNPTHKNIE